MKVVVDTNIFVSAIFWTGHPHEILKLAEDGLIDIVASQEMLDELFGVLARKKFQPYFYQASTNFQDTKEKILKLVSVFPVKEKVDVIKDDPSDNMFLACAFAAQASFIVSGDHHLLNVKKFLGIPILTPKQFFVRYSP